MGLLFLFILLCRLEFLICNNGSRWYRSVAALSRNVGVKLFEGFVRGRVRRGAAKNARSYSMRLSHKLVQTLLERWRGDVWIDASVR
ncbi:hypothetical protein GC56T3_0879 [Geobacillus sp. C56-T3]|nr:hypothetical protein GC56T3_0879 [Geobacillus sp. C56-T3]